MISIPAESHNSTYAVIPLPAHLLPLPGVFDMTNVTPIIIASSGLKGDADQLAKWLSSRLGRAILTTPDELITDKPNGTIRFVEREKSSADDESYELSIRPNEILINAGTPAGAFYAAQSLMQLLPLPTAENAGRALSWPAVEIKDRPRFRWRGLMLDVSRHFFTVNQIKKLLQAMALHKLNVFHWHLTDDQGWRIDIKRYPDLARKGGYRAGGDGKLSPSDGPLLPPAPGFYGGYYTQDDIRDVVAYAATLHITVVPEIEMPGHAVAALSVRPDLSCNGSPLTPATKMGVLQDVFCAGNENTFEFLEDVLAEVCDLFPGPFIHIGGDECPKNRWKLCPKCQARLLKEQLADENELQSYLIRRIERYLNSKGKRLVGWDEILEGGLAPNATVMSWRGTEGGIAAARADHDVIMTPCTQVYLDYRQAPVGEPPASPSDTVITLADLYAYEPVPPELSAQQAKHVIGVQANLWTEYVEDFSHAEYMIWPRGSALAEIAWSSAAHRNWIDFQSRIENHLVRLGESGVNYRPLDRPEPAA
jgi:hexosaminidase